MTYVLFNSLANNHKGEENSRKALEGKISSDSVFEDLTKIVDLKKYLEEKNIEDKVILTGGDGTLNHFVNEIGNLDIKHLSVYDMNFFAFHNKNLCRIRQKFFFLWTECLI